jgi:hypothetical protein
MNNLSKIVLCTRFGEHHTSSKLHMLVCRLYKKNKERDTIVYDRSLSLETKQQTPI